MKKSLVSLTQGGDQDSVGKVMCDKRRRGRVGLDHLQSFGYSRYVASPRDKDPKIDDWTGAQAFSSGRTEAVITLRVHPADVQVAPAPANARQRGRL